MAGMKKRKQHMPEHKVENPGKLLGRVMAYVGKKYKFHLIVVVIGIFASVLANVQGTMFMKTMIDDYIVPLAQADTPDFGPFGMAILRVAAFYMIGVFFAYLYNRLMIYVTQGTLRDLRNDMLQKWKVCLLNILILIHMGILCLYIPMILIPCVRW